MLINHGSKTTIAEQQKNFIYGMPGIISNTFKIRPLPWQQHKGWRCGLGKEPCGDRAQAKAPLFKQLFTAEFLLQSCWQRTYWWQTCWWQNSQTSRHRRMPKRSLGISELWKFWGSALTDQGLLALLTGPVLKPRSVISFSSHLSFSARPPPPVSFSFLLVFLLSLLSNARFILISYKV